MKAESGLVHYNSKESYLNRSSNKAVSKSEKLLKNPSQADKASDLGLTEADKVDISDKAKELKKEGDETISKNKDGAEKTLSKAKDLLTKPGLPLPSLPKASPAPSIEGAQKISESVESKILRKPGIIFISGFELFGLGEASLKEMAENYPESEHFSWNDDDEVIEQILRRPVEEPIVLVGHGLGGDTAVEIANTLNTMKNGFRKVDLLVTIDSVGFNNDIIPQNVAKNLNFISNEDLVFNDAPNIARNTDMTEVVNELRSEDHGDLVETSEVQFKIFDSINSVLTEGQKSRNAEKQRIKNLLAKD